MGRTFYLLNFRMQGIKNIEEPIELNFYKKTITNDFNPEKHKIKAIYGENGSGKTAIVSAVRLMQNIILDKNYLADTDTQKSLFELVNKKKKQGFVECEFYAMLKEIRYIFKYYFEFEIKNDGRFCLIHEKLDCKNGNYSKNSYSTIYEVKNGILMQFGDSEENFTTYRDRTLNLLSQQSFVSSAFDIGLNMKEKKNSGLSMLIMLVFFAVSLCVCLDKSDNHTNYFLMQQIRNMDEEEINVLGIEYIKQINSKLLDAEDWDRMVPKDLYVGYKKYIEKLCTFIRIFKPELKNIKIEKKDYNKMYLCNLIMIYEDYSLDTEFESSGIKKMMKLFSYLNRASNGEIVFIDELDSNINDVYLDKIIEHFLYYGQGQLCFTAHNLSPMSILKGNKNAINFISNINTIHTWTNNGNQSPENAYRNGFIEDSPFNVDASDFLGIIGGDDE